MPAKKKKGESKKSSTTTKENNEHKPIFLTEERENWVILDFRLLNWKYMNFTMKFKEDTRIFTIKKILAKRHGRMTDLKICLHNFTESNEINDEMLTLLECGMRGEPQEIDAEGNPMDSNLPLYQIFYDFKPCEFGDPVLLYFST